MKATFHLAADLDVVIEPHPTNAVKFEVAENIDWDGRLLLSKSEARAIASALMACAAEV